ncbi:MAG: pilus assembly protein N-terminal domain-containing protein [Pseudolabrys sp.]
MSAVYWPRSCRRLRFAAAFALALGAACPALADTVDVNVDQARIMRLPDGVATIVIGNPLIADATLQPGGILVLTGKGYGNTNLMALDRSGRVVLTHNIEVVAPKSADLVVVYRGMERESYSCAPVCERRIMLGDSVPYFNNTLTQSGVRNREAATSSK